MDDRLDRIERRLDELADEIAGITARLDRLDAPATEEHPRPPSGDGVTPTIEGQGPPKTDRHHETVAGVLAVLGRTFLVLCGAFLLRSLTDAAVIPPTAGVGLGFVYALIWLVNADRGARLGRRLAAVLSGLAATAIATPLLWEATTRFSLLSADAAVVALGVFSAVAITICWRRNLEVLAWFVLMAALVTDLAIVLAHRNWASASVFALAAGAVSLWCAYGRAWNGLRWPVAVAVDLVPLMIISVALRAAHGDGVGAPSTAGVVLVGAGLVLVYFGSFAVWTLALDRRIGVFEIVQGIAIVLVGFGGVGQFISRTGVDPSPFGWIATVVGLTSYGVAFAFIDRRSGRGRNFFYYTSLALVLTLWGLSMITSPAGLAVSLCAFAAIAAALGGRFDRVTLRAHSAVFVLASAVASGMLAQATVAIIGSTEAVPPALGPLLLLVVATATGCYAAVVRPDIDPGISWPSRLPALVLAALAAFGIAAIILVSTVHGLDRFATIDRAALATARTAVLSGSAVAAAALAARRRWVEIAWLVYPLLVASGLKLLVEDLRHGRPATLFLGFACFGLALILAPRILRSGGPAPARHID
jgi:hypothetical protein